MPELTRKTELYKALRSRLKVSPEDGDLLKEKWSIQDGYPKGTKNRLYYCIRSRVIDGKPVRLRIHRVIMERVLGRKLESREKVDHIDHDGLNNRRENLRLIEHGLNVGRGRLRRTNTSGIQGVRYSPKHKGWRAALRMHGKYVHIGIYTSKEHAIIAYDAVANLFQGSFYNAELFGGLRPQTISTKSFKKHLDH